MPVLPLETLDHGGDLEKREVQDTSRQQVTEIRCQLYESSRALGKPFGDSRSAGKTNASLKYRNEGFLGYHTPDVALEKPFRRFRRNT